MKVFVSILLTCLACSQLEAKDIDEESWCFIGTVAHPPPKPIACLNSKEIFVCAYGEARCDGLGYCGTPPCTWR